MNTAKIDAELLDHLYELLSQNQFELLTPLDTGRIRLVYLMNDAVESFIVFEDAVLTGYYDAAYEGELEAEFSLEDDGRYLLVVYQGETVCTIFFRTMSLEVHPYNYGKLGHVWMKDHEDLRQIEYWIAVMKAKQEYLGGICCSGSEMDLSALEAFPPLNVCSYPAVPRKYYEPREDADIPKPEGIAFMQKCAMEAGDQKLVRILEHYKKYHGRFMTRYIAWLLRRNRHSAVIALLIEKIREAASIYPDRAYTVEEEQCYARLRKLADDRQCALQGEGYIVYQLHQTPFQEAKDDVEFKVYLLIVSRGLHSRKIRIETFEA